MNGSSSSRRQNCTELSGPRDDEDLPGLRQHLKDVIDESRKIVDDRDGGLVLPKRCVAQISLVDGREQERRVGKELLSVLAREDRGGAADRHDEVRLRAVGEGGSDEVDDRLFRRADRPCRAHDDLHEVHRLFGALVQFDMKVGGEVVEHEVAAVERLQHQDLLRTGLSGRVSPRPPAAQQASQRDARNLRPAPVVAHEAAVWDPPDVLLCARIYSSCIEP